MPSSLLLLYNPEAGRAHSAASALPLLGGRRPESASPETPDWASEALAYLTARRDGCRALACHSFEEARQAAVQAARDGVETVVAAGGDGTLRAVAEGIVGTETMLGILPRGTVNVLARELSIPMDDMAAALDICLLGATRRIDLGRSGDRYFLLMCSVGFDALAVRDVRPELKSVVGANAYVLAGMAALSTFVPPQMTLTLDGRVWYTGQAFMAIVANSPSYGGDLRVAPSARMDDGFLDVTLFTAPDVPLPVQRAAFVRQVGAVTLGLAAADPDIHLLRARQVEISAVPTAPTQIDGDAFGGTPITVEVAPKALTVRVPAP